MAFTRPTIAELIARIQSDLTTRLGLTGAVLRRSLVYVLAAVQAGSAHLLHGHLEYIARQPFADTADLEHLDRLATLYGLTRTAATYAAGPVTVTGTDDTVVPAGTVLQGPDGLEYETDGDVTIAAGTATAAVTALEAGAASNAEVGVVLSFVSPIAGITATATVASGGLVNGADGETDDALRARLLARMQQPPHGGAEADYLAWALENAGVTRAWVYPLELGAGTVTVRFVRDDDASIIPDAGEVATVQAYIDARRPVTAAVTVVAPVAVPRDFTIELTPDTTATRAAVVAELADMLRRDAEPGATLRLSQIQVAIGVAAGVEDFVLTVPAADVTHTTGQIATQGTVTWL